MPPTRCRRRTAPSVVARTIDQLVRESLMIALAMIVRGELVQRLSVGATHRAARCDPGIPPSPTGRTARRSALQFGARGRRPHDPNAGGGQPLLNTAAPLRVAIAEQNPSLAQKSRFARGLP